MSFRLSEDEYEALRNLCSTEGARSVSDFARSKLWQIMVVEPVGEGLGGQQVQRASNPLPTDLLIESMDHLSTVITRLSQLIETRSVNRIEDERIV